MKLGIIADDFTGASDVALTIAEAGMTVVQFMGVPEERADPGLDAGVVALKSRTAPVGAAVAESLAACDWLRDQGAEQIMFKVCSTFDSTPEGNIGPVLEALAERLGAQHVLVTPAYPENGRSVYMGHLFVGDVPLSESGMKDHPLTPMTDSDLRRVLAVQTGWPVAHVPASVVARGADAIRAALPVGRAMVIVDAIRDDDLMKIGRVARDAALVCGGSGIALGLPANFGQLPSAPDWQAMVGRGVVMSGSCSVATRGQVQRYKTNCPAFEITAEAAVKGTLRPEAVADWILSQDAAPLIYSTADPAAVNRAQKEFGRETVAQAIEAIFASLAALLATQGVTRMVVAGGETSGAVVSGLGARALAIGPRAAPGVPLLRVTDRPIALALKSGNFGGPDFFAEALALMETDQ